MNWKRAVSVVCIIGTAWCGLVSFGGVSVAGVKEDVHSHCRVSGGNGWSGREVRRGIRCAVSRWHVPGGARKALSVARCESGFNPRATNGSHDGVFQQARVYWDERARAYDPHHGWRIGRSVWNARNNIVISIVMVHRKGSWRDWSCA